MFGYVFIIFGFVNYLFEFYMLFKKIKIVFYKLTTRLENITYFGIRYNLLQYAHATSPSSLNLIKQSKNFLRLNMFFHNINTTFCLVLFVNKSFDLIWYLKLNASNEMSLADLALALNLFCFYFNCPENKPEKWKNDSHNREANLVKCYFWKIPISYIWSATPLNASPKIGICLFLPSVQESELT